MRKTIKEEKCFRSERSLR